MQNFGVSGSFTQCFGNYTCWMTIHNQGKIRNIQILWETTTEELHVFRNIFVYFMIIFFSACVPASSRLVAQWSWKGAHTALMLGTVKKLIYVFWILYFSFEIPLVYQPNQLLVVNLRFLTFFSSLEIRQLWIKKVELCEFVCYIF